MSRNQLMKLSKKKLVEQIKELEKSVQYFQTRIKDCDKQDKIYDNLFDEYEKVKKELKEIKIERDWSWKRIGILERTAASLAIANSRMAIEADMLAFAKKESKTQRYEVEWEEDK